jgi:hypothetical protein
MPRLVEAHVEPALAGNVSTVIVLGLVGREHASRGLFQIALGWGGVGAFLQQTSL